MAQALVHLTHGKRGMPPFHPTTNPPTNSWKMYPPEYLSKVANLNGRVFDTDPVVTYMLLDMSKEERLTYLKTYWSTLVRSALMNDALITEADGWKAASVIIPPGKAIDNVWTLLYAGFLCVLWRIGFSGLKVGLSELSLRIKPRPTIYSYPSVLYSVRCTLYAVLCTDISTATLD